MHDDEIREMHDDERTTPIFFIQISNSDYIQYTIYKEKERLEQRTENDMNKDLAVVFRFGPLSRHPSAWPMVPWAKGADFGRQHPACVSFKWRAYSRSTRD